MRCEWSEGSRLHEDDDDCIFYLNHHHHDRHRIRISMRMNEFSSFYSPLNEWIAAA